VTSAGLELGTFAASLDLQKKKFGFGWVRTWDSAVSIRCFAAVPLELLEIKEKLRNKYPAV
jgi:hypothetical protein